MIVLIGEYTQKSAVWYWTDKAGQIVSQTYQAESLGSGQ